MAKKLSEEASLKRLRMDLYNAVSGPLSDAWVSDNEEERTETFEQFIATCEITALFARDAARAAIKMASKARRLLKTRDAANRSQGVRRCTN